MNDTSFLVQSAGFLNGASRTIYLFGDLTDYNESISPAEADARALARDWGAIG